jgi:hypothetical protein
VRASNLALAETKPSLLLQGDTPRLIDEWQMAPVLWDAVRFEVDRRGELGQFILTGSAVPRDRATAHTGTGRIVRVRMRTMSLQESGESSGIVSLRALFAGIQEDAAAERRARRAAGLPGRMHAVQTNHSAFTERGRSEAPSCFLQIAQLHERGKMQHSRPTPLTDSTRLCPKRPRKFLPSTPCPSYRKPGLQCHLVHSAKSAKGIPATEQSTPPGSQWQRPAPQVRSNRKCSSR